MRIIGGKLKGKKLTPFRGNSTRPTTDRVRESIFNICASKISNANVLDLFAGTGALGLEALSRGAASAVFIDSATNSVKTIYKNIESCRMADRAKVIKWDILKNLNCLYGKRAIYDLIFMDPPYNENAIGPVLKNLINSDVLKTGTTIIIEHSVSKSILENIGGYDLTDRRKYGKTLVSFLTVMLQENLPETF
ncbi:MAG: 16S rRNA (guanine(966)-N(2))-methyltransferase RsmD [Dissulfuribacterales bacterium]